VEVVVHPGAAPATANRDAVLDVHKLKLSSTRGGGTRASGVITNKGSTMVHSALVCVILHGRGQPRLAVTSFYPVGPIPADDSIRFVTDVPADIARSRVEKSEAFVVADWSF
jgi:hypothetical protein